LVKKPKNVRMGDDCLVSVFMRVIVLVFNQQTHVTKVII